MTILNRQLALRAPLAIACLLLVSGCQLSGGTNPDGSSPSDVTNDVRSFEVSSTANPDLSGFCDLLTRVTVNTSNGTGSISAHIDCTLFGETPSDSSALESNPPSCNMQALAKLTPDTGGSETYQNQFPSNYPSYASCYVGPDNQPARYHPDSPFNCLSGSNCKGAWQVASQYAMEWPGEYRLTAASDNDSSGLQSGDCNVTGSEPGLADIIRCTFVYKLQRK